MTTSASRIFAFVLVAACSAVSIGQTQHITIRVIDGRNGEPVPKQRPLIFAGHDSASAEGEETSLDVTTGPSGTTELLLPTKIRQIKMYTEWRAYCRNPSTPPMFDVTQIITRGITAPNTCGRAHSDPQPGTVIIYLRPESIWEKMQH